MAPTQFYHEGWSSSIASHRIRKRTLTRPEVRIAFIGGTGLRALPGFEPSATLHMDTPWGAPSSPITILHHHGPAHEGSSAAKPTPIAFLARHGLHHELAPHEVPSRANIAALRALGVRCVVAFSAVGSLREDIRPRDFVVPDQVLDRTRGVRPATFFEGGVVGHVGFADPFDAALAEIVRACGSVLAGDDVRLHPAGTLVCIEGPQFSTRCVLPLSITSSSRSRNRGTLTRAPPPPPRRAESNLYRSWGGAVVNMSCLPEAKLAREAELAYQMICMATDYDCWRADSADVDVGMVVGHMAANVTNARRLVAAVLDELTRPQHADVVRAAHRRRQSKLATGITHPDGRKPEALRKLQWLFPKYFKG